MKLLGILPFIISFIFLIILIYQRIKNERKFSADIGLANNAVFGKDILTGITIGLFAMSGIFAVELFLKSIHISGLNPVTLKWFISLFVLIISAGIEEILFRGIIFGGLLRITRTWIAILLASLLFGIAHAGNPNANLISVINNALGGLMYSVAFLYTRSLWLPFSLHFSWNFFQGLVFGFPVSGYNFGGIINQITVGSTWLTGGDYGPEGGLIGMFFRVVIILLLYLYKNHRRTILSPNQP